MSRDGTLVISCAGCGGECELAVRGNGVAGSGIGPGAGDQDGGSVEMNDTIETPVEPGRHTLQVRNDRNSSRTQTFDAAEGEVVAFRCTGKRFLPLFLASFVVPSLALKLRRE